MKKRNLKNSKKNLQVKRDDLNETSWFTQMERLHSKALTLFKNVLLSNGYSSFEIAFSDIDKSYSIFKQFLEDQGVKVSDKIKKNASSLKSALESALKNIEKRYKLV